MDSDSDELEASPDLGRMGRWTTGPGATRWKDGREREPRVRDHGTDSDEEHPSLKFCSPEVPFF